MKHRPASTLLLGLLAGACGTIVQREPALTKAQAGDVQAPASLAVLPELTREDARRPRVHRGVTLAQQLFAESLPLVPSDHGYAALQQWIDADVAPWLQRRREGIDEARFQMLGGERVAETESVVAHALVALLHEDTATSFARIPAPAELDSEPEIAELFRELLRKQADPFVTQALREYQLCVERGDDAGGGLTRFARFCGARAKRLRPDPR